MGSKRIRLSEAIKFHGHLGPYLTLGLLMGEYALEKLRAKKYFGLTIKVKGALKKPKSCLIDGLQLSTGATFGKGNIEKLNGRDIEVIFCNLNNKRKITLSLKDTLKSRLEKINGHRDSEILADEIYRISYNKLFNLSPVTRNL